MNRFNKLDYPLIQVHNKLYQEKSPGVLSEWQLRYAQAKYGRDVTYQIEYYIGFTCDPSHINYKRTIDDHYNLYKKLTHKPKKGQWKNIENFIIHIFGKEQFEMALEYLWNLYIQPKQRLPFLGLVSAKKETGKSTFLNLLELIFQDNATPITAEDLKSQFNEHYINSLILMSDEHYHGSQRIHNSERIKNLITEERSRVEGKNKATYKSKNYFKFVFAGNDEDLLTIIEEENTRYWIVKVPNVIEPDHTLLSKLEKEIPAFLYYLKEEFEPRPSRGRLYFNALEFQNKAVQRIQKNSASILSSKISKYIKKLFAQYNVNKISYTCKHLSEDLNISNDKNLKDALKHDLGLYPSTDSIYHKIGCRELEKQQNADPNTFIVGLNTSATGRCYTFSRAEFG